ncbi:hypothetical protein KBB68_02895 [Candidatus Babeliales bacterium]|nr:hypothetical protein [Candidatus Babeliales bacterium]
MKCNLFLLILTLCQSTQPIIFNGLTETNISKNNFLCPVNSSSPVSCKESITNATGFNFSSGKILQIFNDQAFWLHEEAVQSQYVSQVLSYTGSELQNKMNADGWGAMGSYCIIISIDPILTSIAQPKLTPKNDEEKLVVQLWYNGDGALQLWSQDVQVLQKNATFTIAVNNSSDPLPGVIDATSNSQTSLRAKFLSELHLQQNSRKESVYQIATQSPRSIKIQIS